MLLLLLLLLMPLLSLGRSLMQGLRLVTARGMLVIVKVFDAAPAAAAAAAAAASAAAAS